MKKRFLRICTVLSLVMLTSCGGIDNSGAGEVNAPDNGSGPDESRGRIEDEEDEEEEVAIEVNTISGSIIPVVSGDILPVEDGGLPDSVVSSNVSKGRELIAAVISDEEAQEIAELYGIELIEVNYGIAVYHTEEDPKTVIQRGIDNGWPPVGQNRSSSLIE